MKNRLKIFYDNNYTVLMSTKLLLKNSMSNNLQNAHILIRYYVAKCFLENKTTKQAFKLYNQMQKARVEFNPKIPKHMAENEQNFKNLITSIKTKGFNYNYPIIINKKLKLVNGSHRLAIALLLGIEKVPVKIEKPTEKVDNYYGPKWFEQVGLKEHIKIIEKYKYLCE